MDWGWHLFMEVGLVERMQPFSFEIMQCGSVAALQAFPGSNSILGLFECIEWPILFFSNTILFSKVLKCSVVSPVCNASAIVKISGVTVKTIEFFFFLRCMLQQCVGSPTGTYGGLFTSAASWSLFPASLVCSCRPVEQAAQCCSHTSLLTEESIFTDPIDLELEEKCSERVWKFAAIDHLSTEVN